MCILFFRGQTVEAVCLFVVFFKSLQQTASYVIAQLLTVSHVCELTWCRYAGHFYSDCFFVFCFFYSDVNK